MTNAELDAVSRGLRRLEREQREAMRAGARVERRLIHGQWVDVTVCPPSEALGDVAPCHSMAENRIMLTRQVDVDVLATAKAQRAEESRRGTQRERQ